MDMKQRNMPQDGWYLYNLVVRKEAQHQGLAKRLLQPCLKFFDDEKQCVYLETHDPKNIAFYEHFGFAVVETGTVPHSDLTHYGLLREPK
jgi:ribosomal protein S18 acetylase RimI-like enzyme